MSSVTNRRRVGVGQRRRMRQATEVGVGLVPGQSATGITAVVLKGGHDFWGSVPSANEHPTDAEKQALKNRLQELLANKIDISLISPGISKWDNEYRSGSLFFKFHLRPDVTIPINRWSELTGGGTPKTLIDLTIEGGSLKSGISRVSGRGVINPPENYYGTGITTLREEPKQLPRMREAPKQAPRMRAAPPQPVTRTQQTMTTQPMPGAATATAPMRVRVIINNRFEIVNKVVPEQTAKTAYLILAKPYAPPAAGPATLLTTILQISVWSRERSDVVQQTGENVLQVLALLGLQELPEFQGQTLQLIPGVRIEIFFGEPPYARQTETGYAAPTGVGSMPSDGIPSVVPSAGTGPQYWPGITYPWMPWLPGWSGYAVPPGIDPFDAATRVCLGNQCFPYARMTMTDADGIVSTLRQKSWPLAYASLMAVALYDRGFNRQAQAVLDMYGGVYGVEEVAAQIQRVYDGQTGPSVVPTGAVVAGLAG